MAQLFASIPTWVWVACGVPVSAALILIVLCVRIVAKIILLVGPIVGASWLFGRTSQYVPMLLPDTLRTDTYPLFLASAILWSLYMTAIFLALKSDVPDGLRKYLEQVFADARPLILNELKENVPPPFRPGGYRIPDSERGGMHG